MIALKVIKGPSHKGQTYPLEKGQTRLVGRSQGCDIRLDSKDISKRHCRLTVLPGGKAEVEDLGSSNGTYINGVLIKKHLAKAGDYIGVSNYILQIGVDAPNVDGGVDFGGEQSASGQNNEGAANGNASAPEKLQAWLAKTAHPWADKLSVKYDVRALVATSLFLWIIATLIFTTVPFAFQANQTIKETSAEVAQLYARQLARINQQAILEQRYSDLIDQLDVRPGQTTGVVKSYILDAQKRIILSPASEAGNNFPSRFAVVAAQKEIPWVSYSNDGLAYASQPIKIGVSLDGRVETRVEAISFVVFDTRSNVFNATDILNQIVNGFIVAALLSLFLLVFLQQWTEGTLERIHVKIKNAIKNSEVYLEPVEVRWNKVNAILDDMTSLLGRISGGSGGTIPGAVQNGWAPSSVAINLLPSASFDESLVVTGWNEKMESLIGIRAHIAIGNDISGASRDLAFESTVRALADECLGQEWVPVEKPFEISGVEHKISMLYGQNSFYLTLKEEGEE